MAYRQRAGLARVYLNKPSPAAGIAKQQNEVLVQPSAPPCQPCDERATPVIAAFDDGDNEQVRPRAAANLDRLIGSVPTAADIDLSKCIDMHRLTAKGGEKQQHERFLEDLFHVPVQTFVQLREEEEENGALAAAKTSPYAYSDDDDACDGFDKEESEEFFNFERGDVAAKPARGGVPSQHVALLERQTLPAGRKLLRAALDDSADPEVRAEVARELQAWATNGTVMHARVLARRTRPADPALRAACAAVAAHLNSIFDALRVMTRRDNALWTVMADLAMKRDAAAVDYSPPRGDTKDLEKYDTNAEIYGLLLRARKRVFNLIKQTESKWVAEIMRAKQMSGGTQKRSKKEGRLLDRFENAEGDVLAREVRKTVIKYFSAQFSGVMDTAATYMIKDGEPIESGPLSVEQILTAVSNIATQFFAKPAAQARPGAPAAATASVFSAPVRSMDLDFPPEGTASKLIGAEALYQKALEQGIDTYMQREEPLHVAGSQGVKIVLQNAFNFRPGLAPKVGAKYRPALAFLVNVLAVAHAVMAATEQAPGQVDPNFNDVRSEAFSAFFGQKMPTYFQIQRDSVLQHAFKLPGE